VTCRSKIVYAILRGWGSKKNFVSTEGFAEKNWFSAWSCRYYNLKGCGTVAVLAEWLGCNWLMTVNFEIPREIFEGNTKMVV
jgi:hypothetical protein